MGSRWQCSNVQKGAARRSPRPAYALGGGVPPRLRGLAEDRRGREEGGRRRCQEAASSAEETGTGAGEQRGGGWDRGGGRHGGRGASHGAASHDLRVVRRAGIDKVGR